MPPTVFAQATTVGGVVRQPLADMFWGDRHGQPPGNSRRGRASSAGRS
jgi:hypothetical protein